MCVNRGADGIGLYRTEFLYLGAESEPSEEEHHKAYSEVVQAMGGKPVVIRTLDLGADKMGHLPLGEEEQNPVLGLRSIRLSLRNQSLFRIQLRAILRASSLGDVRLMFPLITTIKELRQAKTILNDIMEDLEDEGVPFNRDIQVGIMIEVPSAVIMIDRFLKEVDFVSVGTNDLAQYTLAVDRGSREVAALYQAVDPAVLRLIYTTIQATQASAIPANVCGQMSSNPAYAMLLIGMGVRGMSVPPIAIPEIKKICRSVTVLHCQTIMERVMDMENAQEIDVFLQDELRKTVPELVT